MTHTPGPWEVFWSEARIMSKGDGIRGVAEVLTVKDCEWAPVDRANARLIAAAPDMLEILKQVERTFGDRFPDVVAVIKKAESHEGSIDG